MKLTWHHPACIGGRMEWEHEDGGPTNDHVDTELGDILVLDHKTGIVYQGRWLEGPTGDMEADVKAFLAST